MYSRLTDMRYFRPVVSRLIPLGALPEITAERAGRRPNLKLYERT